MKSPHYFLQSKFKITPPSWAIGGYVFMMKNLTTDEETEIINDDASLRQFNFNEFNFPELKNDNTYEFSYPYR